LPILEGFLVVGLFLVFFVDRTSTRRGRLAVAAAACVLLPIVPVWPMFFVAPDLQGARYVYLATVGWSALIVVLASEPGDNEYLKSLSSAAVLGLLVVSVFGANLQLRPWRRAAQLRDAVEAAALARAVPACPSISLESPPDSIRGAYVFRNGLREAFARDLRLHVTPGEAQEGCAFQWSNGRLLSRP
jgi:peptidoglycan/LPS O-acetylase OafA/YrhL